MKRLCLALFKIQSSIKNSRYINDEIFLQSKTLLLIKLGCIRENQLAFHRESENTMTVARCCTTCVSRSLKKKEKYNKRTPSPYAETLNTHIVSWKHSLAFFFSYRKVNLSANLIGKKCTPDCNQECSEYSEKKHEGCCFCLTFPLCEQISSIVQKLRRRWYFR